MPRKHLAFVEHHYETADELWLAVSPTSKLGPGAEDLIYRGQSDARWPLVPSILRPRQHPPIFSKPGLVDATEMVFYEIMMLNEYARHCDAIGIAVPNDSPGFRRDVIEAQTADRYFKNPSLWPNPEVLDLMAMAQHHGVPTRLLDWTTKPFTSLYFAASSALANNDTWIPEQRLAIWAINRAKLGLHPKIKLHTSPGVISKHLAAQGGLFTVHPHSGSRRSAFEVHGLESYFEDLPPSLFKLTLPVFEAGRLLTLCCRAGFSGAEIYPTPDGAGKAVIDGLNIEGARYRWNTTEVLVRI
ncbi:FRG domain-containing protein [Pseudomonas sp. RW3S2]|uniref:FRG domain-containing protein n=1 Tax=Pseudomonas sp. RW3S2 TaxID=485884 RepID=UPI00164699C9|nr:FRG domain-containing protein [Pseudomonas sp. RW3S2]MBC3420693.1 FRG domain-containing protein [Pseudomonas sp. RW3S2]